MAKCITPSFVQKGILSPDDAIEIQKGLTERARVEIFLQKLVLSKPTSFDHFTEVLRETNQEFIVLELQKDTDAQEDFPAIWTSGDEANIKRMIKWEREYILDQLHPDKILGFFVERGIFNIEIIADMTFKSRKEKARILLESVLQNLPSAFNLLLHALRQTESDQLASCLSEMVSRTRDVTMLGKSKQSEVQIQIKATLCGEDMQPLIELETYLVNSINTEQRENVREAFLKETESMLKNATFGSLIIHITLCSKKSYKRILKFCQNRSFEKLLKNLLSNEKAKQLLPHGPITVNLELRAIDVIDEGATSEVAKFRDRLIEDFDTVVEEINPMNFKRVFVDRRLLSEDYFHQLGEMILQSRSSSAADFVLKVLELGEDAILAFKETIEKDGPEYLLAVLSKHTTEVADDPDNDELIATLKVTHQNSSRSDGFIFYDSSFQMTMQDFIDLKRTPPSDSAKGLNTPGALPVVDNPRKINSADRYPAKQLYISTPDPRRRSSSDFAKGLNTPRALPVDGNPRKIHYADRYPAKQLFISTPDPPRRSSSDSSKGLNTPVVDNQRKSHSADSYPAKQLCIHMSITPSRSSSGFSDDSRFSSWSEADPAMDLEGDLSS
ncbi:hypothetical protein ACJMK2_014469 [Sinanodonta woodiana]|uniref:CARD domain-containing protein n=1 Tax=Sinanodonta woodiana TaxID=1069815 RepID=A0ABD3V3W5_SINWO